ncbi:MAG: hypothetical protein U0263_31315 [Polyangiaceae bacterium]
MTSRENDERRKTLAHSYRGDVEALINDLGRQELVEIFRQLTFDVGGDEMYLPNPVKYRHDELRAFAIRAFVGRRVRIVGEFRPASELEGFDDEEFDDDGQDYAWEESSLDEGADEAGEVEDAGHPFRALSADWSRPRMIARLLRKLGRDVPERLRAPRFQELVADLREMGIDACLADDPSCTPLGDDAESPGIAAKLRLRLAGARQSASGPRTEAPREDRSAAARKAWETRRAQSAGDAGPPIVVQAGERPVSQRVPRPSDYNLAVLRLQFLTAVPSVQRRAMPEWPSVYLEAATRGLHLRPQEETLLRAYSAGLSIGNHSPYDAIPHLSQALSATEWEQLLEDFVALNPFQPEFVQAIVEQIEPVTAPRSQARTWKSAEPTPEDLREPTKSSEPSRERAAASGRSTSVAPEPEQPGTNVRDLGALSGMFDDE